MNRDFPPLLSLPIAENQVPRRNPSQAEVYARRQRRAARDELENRLRVEAGGDPFRFRRLLRNHYARQMNRAARANTERTPE